MALPTDVKLIKITGNFRIGLGGVPPNPATSKVEFALPKRLRDPDADPAQRAILITETIVGKLNASGNLKAEDGTSDLFVIATNDADLDPTGWTYTITETINGVPLPSYAAIIPFNAAGDTIDLTELVNVAASGGTVAVRMNEIGGPPALEDDGSGQPRVPLAFLPANVVTGVSSVDGFTGAVELDEIYAPKVHDHAASDIESPPWSLSTHNHDGSYLTQNQGDARYILRGTPLYRPSTQQITVREMYWGGGGHGFFDVGGVGTVNLNDTTVFALGDRSIHMTAGVGVTGNVAAGAGGLPVFSAQGRVPVVWLRVKNPAVITSLRVWLGNSANDQSYVWDIVETSDWTWIPDATGMADGDGWVRISLPFGRAFPNNTFPHLTALAAIRVDFTTDGTAEAQLWWGGIGLADLQNLYPNGVVSLLFPTGRKACLTQAKPYMDRYGYAGSVPAVAQILATPGTYGTDYLTLAEAHRLEDMSGWEVMTMANAKAVVDAADGYISVPGPNQYADMDAAKTYLAGNGFRSPDLLHYPAGAWDTVVRGNAKSLFGLAVTDNRPSNETLPIADPWKVRATRFTSTMTEENLEDWVAEVGSSPGGDWGIALIEDIVTTPANPWEVSVANFQAFVNALAAEGVEVFTLSEILAGV